MTTDYQTPTSVESRLDRSRRLWRAAFIGTVTFLIFYATFCISLMAGWLVLPEWLLRHFD
jgi:hypothetical protein